MITVQSIFSDSAQRAHREEQLDRYFAKAIDVFSDQFPVFGKSLSEPEKLAFVRLAYERSKKLAFRTEKDHLQCMIAFVFLGSYFDTDYQFFDDLYFAGWSEKNGYKPSLKRLCHQINLYASETKKDLASQRRIMSSLVEISYATTTPDVVSDLLFACSTIWPHRAARMRLDISKYWASQCLNDAQNLGLLGTDAVLHGTVGLYFGRQFYRDPLCPWAMKAYEVLPAFSGPELDTWRVSLLDGVQTYFEARAQRVKGN